MTQFINWTRQKYRTLVRRNQNQKAYTYHVKDQISRNMMLTYVANFIGKGAGKNSMLNFSLS